MDRNLTAGELARVLRPIGCLSSSNFSLNNLLSTKTSIPLPHTEPSIYREGSGLARRGSRLRAQGYFDSKEAKDSRRWCDGWLERVKSSIDATGSKDAKEFHGRLGFEHSEDFPSAARFCEGTRVQELKRVRTGQTGS